jgi:hypothetical protein
MKIKKCITLLCLLLTLLVPGIAEEPKEILLGSPSFNPNIGTYFSTQMQDMVPATVEIRNDLRGFGYYTYLSAFIDIYDPEGYSLDSETGKISADLFGFADLIINKYVSIPFYYGYATGTGETMTKQDNLVGSGLIVNSKIGIISGFIGWTWNTIAPIDSDRYEHVEPDQNLFYSILPQINVGKFPVIGLLWDSLEAYVGLNKDPWEDMAVTLISKSFDIGSVTIDSLDLIYKKQPYTLDANRASYGLGVGINQQWGIELGYRDYYDILGYPDRYENTMYARIEWAPKSAGAFYAEFDSLYMPKIGFYGGYGGIFSLVYEIRFAHMKFDGFTLGMNLLLDYFP